MLLRRIVRQRKINKWLRIVATVAEHSEGEAAVVPKGTPAAVAIPVWVLHLRPIPPGLEVVLLLRRAAEAAEPTAAEDVTAKCFEIFC
jgi:hypothetical protein